RSSTTAPGSAGTPSSATSPPSKPEPDCSKASPPQRKQPLSTTRGELQAGRGRDRADSGNDAEGRHALVHPRAGEAERAEPVDDLADLAHLRPQAAPGRHVQAEQGSAVH